MAKETTCLEVIGSLAVVMISAIVDCLVDGWVLSTMWRWFVVTLFGLPPLSIPYAIGISLIMALFRSRSSPSSTDTDDIDWGKLFKATMINLLVPLFILFCGWIVHMFIG